MEKLRDYAAEALARVGESGVYDRSLDRLDQLGLGVLAYVDSPEFRRDANRVSTALDRTLSNVSDAVQRFLRSVSGTSGDVGTIEGAAGAAASGIERLAALSDNLPAALETAGELMGAAAGRIGEFVDAVILLGNAASDPAAYASRAGSGVVAAMRAAPGAAGATANDQTLDVLRSAGVDVNGLGRSYYSPEVSPDRLYVERRAAGDGFAGATGAAVMQTFRDITGSTQAVETLDLRRLPPELRQAVTRLQADFADDGTADPALLAEVRRIAGLVGRGLPVAAAPDVAGAADRLATVTGRGNSIPASVARIVGEEGTGGPNFGASLQASAAALSRLGGQQQTDALRELSGSSARVLASNIGPKEAPVRLDAVFDQLGRQFDDRRAILEQAFTEGAAQARGAADPELDAYLDVVRNDLARLVQAHADATTLAASGFEEAARGVGRQLSEALEGVPYSSGMQAQLAAGVHGFAKSVAGVLDRAGVVFDRAADLGFQNLPLDERQQFTRRTIEGRQRDIESFGRTGELRAGLSAGQVALAFDQRPSDRQVAALRMQSLQQQALPAQGAILRDANAAYSTAPDDPAAFRDSAVAVQQYGELLALSQQLQQQADPFRESWVRASADVRQALDGGLGRGLADMLNGVGTLQDALRGFASDLVGIFSRKCVVDANRPPERLTLPAPAETC